MDITYFILLLHITYGSYAPCGSLPRLFSKIRINSPTQFCLMSNQTRIGRRCCYSYLYKVNIAIIGTAIIDSRVNIRHHLVSVIRAFRSLFTGSSFLNRMLGKTTRTLFVIGFKKPNSEYNLG